MSRISSLQNASLPADALAVLSCECTEDYSEFFGIDQSDALHSSGLLDKVLELMLHPVLVAGGNPVVDKLREDYEEEEYTVYVPVSDPLAEPVTMDELDEEDFEEDGETVRSDRFTMRVDRELVAEIDFDDTWDHPSMSVMSTRSGSYDHKRKYLDISAEIRLTVGEVLQLSDADLQGWAVTVATALGMTELS